MAKIKIDRDYSAILDSMYYIINEADKAGLSEISHLLEVVMDIVKNNVQYDSNTEVEMYKLINTVYEQAQDKSKDVRTIILECVKDYNLSLGKIIN